MHLPQFVAGLYALPSMAICHISTSNLRATELSPFAAIYPELE
jgi:hypothetical protein